MSSVRGEEAKYSDRSKDMFENHFYEEGVSKYHDNSMGSFLPNGADENMSVECNNIKERLNQFWNCTVKKVQVEFASAIDHEDLGNP